MTSVADLSEDKRRLLRNQLRGVLQPPSSDLLVRRNAKKDVPLSAEQYHLWLHASMAPEVPLYNEAFTIHRTGSFNLEALERAVNEIVRRHEIWRTSFELNDGAPRALVHPGLRLSVEFNDFSYLPDEQRDTAALRLAQADAQRPFDLSQLPLVRVRVVRLSSDLHRIYFALHHIIFDGISIYRILVPELVALYQTFAEGLSPALSEPTLQYGDYALWRERQLSTEGMDGELAYWRTKLDGELPRLNLPSDRPATMQPTYRGAMETFALPGRLLERLKALAAQERVTIYATLLAGFKAMLHRYTGQDDIIVGGLTDMRRRRELENLMGYVLNSMALRTRPTPDMPFRAYLAEVQATAIEALETSIVPFDRVVREIRPMRDGHRHPLFQVMFSIQPPMPRYPDGWSLTQMDVAIGTAKFDLYLELEEKVDRILGRFLYNTELFEANTIGRMIGHFATLLEGAVDNPDCPLGRLPLLTDSERHNLLLECNATVREYPQTTVPGSFEAQAVRSPNATAVEFDGFRWTYGDLRRRVARLVARLQQAGVERETLVGVAVERSLDMVAGLLAILEAGGAYLPLDPELPAARLAWLVEDARPTVILAEPSLLGRLPPSDARIVLCNEEPEQADAAEPVVIESRVGPDDLAYVLYTSGSTGRPKAVEITHRSLSNFLLAMGREIDFDAKDSLLAVTTFSFDIAALELFLPLITGGRLILCSCPDATDPVRLAAVIRQSNCTTMQATPATWRGLLEAGWAGDERLKILCGGEALPLALANALRQRSGALWNVYGPTETTIWALSHKVCPGDLEVPLGRPLSNYRAYVMDSDGAPVPVGIPGELLIAGAGLARGYRNDPTLTNQKFVTLPALPGERVYRTGDLVRRRVDGTIEFLGRKDNQVKIRGFRVGLEEVESTIATYPRCGRRRCAPCRTGLESSAWSHTWSAANSATPPSPT